MTQDRLLGGRYRLDAVVGRGGMGTVWRAYDLTLDREVAIKEVVLPPGLSAAERGVLYERTFREARASARLNHPGVVTVHDVVEARDRPWIVMELVRARSLQDLLELGPLEHRRVAEIGLQMLAALRAAHEKGILHRDVKPSNVLITDTGRVVLTDFGIAQVEGDATLTQTGLVMGSPAYIPPERAAGERAVPASDLWALGATLYAALEGHSPYERSDAMSSLQAALTEPVPRGRNAGPLAPVLDGLLAREPRHRMSPDEARPLLTRVASMPAPSPAPPPPSTVVEDTVLDDLSGFSAKTVTDDKAASTVLDSSELEPVTRRESGRALSRDPGPARPTSHDSGPSRSGPSSHDVGPSRSGQSRDPGPSRAGLSRDQPQDRRAPRPDPRSWTPEPTPPPTPPPVPNEQEARTLLEPNAWEPHPSNQGGWDGSSSYPHWPDRTPSYDRERRRTMIVVTIAVIVAVAAVLAGAFIVRQRVNHDEGAPRPHTVVTTPLT
ncbi:serine/threonine-protein kinase [Actinomadura rayongensis]|uniref:non-specific serine/threonine protein kinase n=1 Tax=Actinomadura rayongensis TaxID=1429076 RepID=A0A6I4WJY5_9ACTN|nr:serine/threonine-protein kinase [Actinomadura rayongensis]MXQ67996.1 protein kinase [Actinomadura rayongensis]